MRWPFKAWGATAIFSGHNHVYERVIKSSFPYFVDGLGGKDIHDFGSAISGSVVRYNDDFGAMKVWSNPDSMKFWFVSQAGAVVDSYLICHSLVDVEEVPQSTSLLGIYPNPFNSSVEIEYSVQTRSFVSLEVYDILGRNVRNLIAGEISPGEWTVSWDASRNASGVYFVRFLVQSGLRQFSEVKKVLHVK